jgi:putative oxidoreductase
MLSGLDPLRGFAPLVLRLACGVIFIVHGYGKLFSGMADFKAFVASLGLPGILAWAAAGIEFFGGAALILGLLTRWAALGIAAVMAVAILKVHLPHGLTGENGYEFPLILLAVAVSLMLIGGGPVSLDALLIEKKS